jgi:hypothetical protein
MAVPGGVIRGPLRSVRRGPGDLQGGKEENSVFDIEIAVALNCAMTMLALPANYLEVKNS